MRVCWPAALGQVLLSLAAAGPPPALLARAAREAKPLCGAYAKNGVSPVTDAATCKAGCCTGEGWCQGANFKDGQCQCGKKDKTGATNKWMTLCDVDAPAAAESPATAADGTPFCGDYTKNGVSPVTDEATCTEACCTGEGFCAGEGAEGHFSYGRCDCGKQQSGRASVWITLCRLRATGLNASNASSVPAVNYSEPVEQYDTSNLTAVRGARDLAAPSPPDVMQVPSAPDLVEPAPFPLGVDTRVNVTGVTSVRCLTKKIQDPAYVCSAEDLTPPPADPLAVGPPGCRHYSKNGQGPVLNASACETACCSGEGWCQAASFKDFDGAAQCQCGKQDFTGATNKWMTLCAGDPATVPPPVPEPVLPPAPAGTPSCRVYAKNDVSPVTDRDTCMEACCTGEGLCHGAMFLSGQCQCGKKVGTGDINTWMTVCADAPAPAPPKPCGETALKAAKAAEAAAKAAQNAAELAKRLAAKQKAPVALAAAAREADAGAFVPPQDPVAYEAAIDTDLADVAAAATGKVVRRAAPDELADLRAAVAGT